MNWRDQDRVEAWLKPLPQEVTVAFAARAVLRVVPLAMESYRIAEMTFPSLRASLIAGVAGTGPTPKMKDAARAAAAAADAAPAADPTRAFAADAASRAAAAALSSAVAAFASATAASRAATAADAIAAATSNPPFAAAIAMDADKARIDQGVGNAAELFNAPLWPDGKMPDELAKPWQDFQTTAPDQTWGFWKRWYQSMLQGQPMDWELQKRIALIDPKTWDQGPEAVAQKIAEIEAEFWPSHSPAPAPRPVLLWEDESLTLVPQPASMEALEDAQRRMFFDKLKREVDRLANRFGNQFPQIRAAVEELQILLECPFEEADIALIYFESDALIRVKRDDSRRVTAEQMDQDCIDLVDRVINVAVQVYQGTPDAALIADRQLDHARVQREVVTVEAETKLAERMAEAEFVTPRLKAYFDQLSEAEPDDRLAEHRPSFIKNGLIKVLEAASDIRKETGNQLQKKAADELSNFIWSYKDQIYAFFQSHAREALSWVQAIIQQLPNLGG